MPERPTRCLLLKTPDERCFFTNERHLPVLVEFIRTCNVEVSVVLADKPNLLDLEELAKSVCNHGKQAAIPQYEVIETLIASGKKTRKSAMDRAAAVQRFVIDHLQAGEVVTLRILASKFDGLSRGALYGHVAKARSKLGGMGYRVEKVGKGQYKAHAKS